MTVEQVITLRKYVDGAYPQLRQRSKEEIEDTDTVWFDLLKDEDYYLAMQSVKNYIRSGNPYPPGISNVIDGCKTVILQYNNRVLEAMEADGYFDDVKSESAEVSKWNKDNRIRKARAYVSEGYPKERIPEWFRRDYQRYETGVKQSLINSKALIGDEKAIASRQ